jgi:hypothetical protein
VVNLRRLILFVTFLLFIYNAFFTYIIIELTTGIQQFLFLIFISLDYVIIFYFILSIAAEIRKETKTANAGKTGKKGVRKKG